MPTDNGERSEQRFDVGRRSELSVSNVSGRTRVRAVEGSEIVVRYDKRETKWGAENTQVEVSKSGNRVSVQTRSRTTGLLNFSRSSPVEYDITVPPDCSVTLQAVSADQVLEGTRGDAGLRTVSGDVKIKDVVGDVSITTVSGDVMGSQISGTLISRSTSGDTTVLGSRLRRFSLSSVSGDFKIETPLAAEEQSNAKTVSGDLDLLLPSSNGATVQLKSVSGSVSCDLPAEIIKAGRRHWQGRINGGGGQVEMNSVSGDLHVRRSSAESVNTMPMERVSETRAAEDANWAAGAGNGAQDVPESHDTTPEEEEEPVDVAAILAAVEKGDLSIEDAMAQIG